MKLLRNVWNFFKNPEYVTYPQNTVLRRKVFTGLLILNIIIAIGLGLLGETIRGLLNIDVGSHEMETLFNEYSVPLVAFLAIVLAPLLEESIFRAPLALFKTSRYFSWAVYISILLFGLVHLFNFTEYENAIWLAPLLIAPQLITGLFLTFIRVRMGFVYGVLYHALFNALLIGPMLLIKLLDPEIH